MTTLEYMERILNKHKKNLIAVERKSNVPADDIKYLRIKIGHYEKVCDLLRKEAENETFKK